MLKETRQHVIGDFLMTGETEYHWGDTYRSAYKKLYSRSGQGCEMTDWIDWPIKYLESDEYKRLKKTAKKIREQNDAVIVVGIGGSYLTPKMVIQSEFGESYNEFAEENENPKIYFVGCDLSPDRINGIMDLIEGCDWSIIYISKSGGTIEPALTFRTFWKKLYDLYGEEADNRVYAVTDAQKGILRELANEHGWESFVIPDGIGGRYSAFTACGLLPIAVAGINTDKLLQGAVDAISDCKEANSFAGKYAMWRYYNYFCESKVELYAVNAPELSFLSEWLKQLFGESEGKNGLGLFPTSVVFPTDLHSLGQALQDGVRDIIFETFISRDFKSSVKIPQSDLKDSLNKYQEKDFSQASAAAMDGASKAHTEGGNPCCMIRVGNTLEDLGYLMQCMFVACAIYCYMIGVNPFNQPGVELHKKQMKSSPEWDK